MVGYLLRVALDRNGMPIKIGNKVKISKKISNLEAHPDFRKSFNEIAGKIKTVVGWDHTGGAWIPYGEDEVLTIDTKLLEVVKEN